MTRASSSKKTRSKRTPAAPAAIDVFDDLAGPCRSLARRSPALRVALRAIDRPHVRRRTGGFEGLFRIIVEQQVSVPSAQAIWGRLSQAFDVADPEAIRAVGAPALCAQGLSRPKAGYVIGLADGLASGELCLASCAALDNDAAADALTAVKGVGPWSASIYLLFCEGRVDIWPPKDVALKAAFNAANVAAAKASRRSSRQSSRQIDDSPPGLPQAEIDALAADWAPYRGVAAHILWTYYARMKGRTPI